MKSRIEGVQKAKHHLYQGKKILPKEEFYEWAKSSPEFWKLFDDWTYHSYKRTMTPSVDRVDPKEGYVISNMEWVTHSENSRRSSEARKRLS